MPTNFTQPPTFNYENKRYVFEFQRQHNNKGHLLPSMHYYYKIDGKGKLLPFPKKQLEWILEQIKKEKI